MSQKIVPEHLLVTCNICRLEAVSKDFPISVEPVIPGGWAYILIDLHAVKVSVHLCPACVSYEKTAKVLKAWGVETQPPAETALERPHGLPMPQ